MSAVPDVRGPLIATTARLQGGHADAAAARLLIHAGRSARRRRPADAKALWQWWMDRATPPASSPDATHLLVEAAAEPGHPLLALRDPEGTVEMMVGAGTYDITVIAGGRKRRYTVTLDAGTTFDLDLQEAMQSRA